MEEEQKPISVPVEMNAKEIELVEKSRAIIQSDKSLNELERILQAEFPPERIRKLIVDLCEAEDVRMSKMGAYATPNWDARKNGIDRVLNLLRYTKKEGRVIDGPPTKIVFQILNNTSAPHPPIPQPPNPTP